MRSKRKQNVVCDELRDEYSLTMTGGFVSTGEHIPAGDFEKTVTEQSRYEQRERKIFFLDVGCFSVFRK